jgi:putative membrane protein
MSEPIATTLKEMLMRTLTNYSRLICIAALAAGAAGQAQALSDEAFMKQAAQSGAAEIEASKMAAAKAQNADVKAFAQKMVADHTKVDGELKQLAASKKVELPAEPSAKQKADLKLVSSASGSDFDARYAQSFGVKAHEETIKLFEEAARDSKDSEVKAWAQKTLPNLKHHLEMAKALPAASKK